MGTAARVSTAMRDARLRKIMVSPIPNENPLRRPTGTHPDGRFSAVLPGHLGRLLD
ncbi:hypothetical protein GCM10027187_16150 [Streptosporangium sandarakinum]